MATTSTKKKPKPAKAPAEDSSAFGPIAERFRRAGDLERAVSLCREGLQKYPDHVSARVTLGWALLELSRYDESRTELELVLRRRPDNLAAIRALAELHDRSEHTLNLPMDGPGQWPPSDDAVDAATADTTAEAVDAPPVAESVVEPELIVSGHNYAITSAAPEPAVMPPAEIGLAMWSAAPEPEAQAVADVESPAQEPLSAEVFAAPFQAESVAASETDIAALLAEAESLEAAAEAVQDEVASAATVLLDEELDLGSLAVETAATAEPKPSYAEEAAAQAEAEAAAAAVRAEIEAAAREEAEAAAAEAAAAQAQAEAEAAAAAQARAEAEAAAAAKGQAELEAAAAQAEIEAAAAAAVAAAQARAELEAAAAAEAAALAEAEANAFKLVAPTLEDFPESVADLEELVAATSVDRKLQPELIWELKEAPAVKVVSIVRAAEPARPSPLPKLERFLGQVQSRRRQLVAESVA